jgi:hypothetical protein
MQLESDGLRLRMLKAVGASCLRIDGQPIWALFVSEFEPIDINGTIVESHEPLLVCRTSDVKRLQIAKGQVVEGLPSPFRVKNDDGGDRTAIALGQWAGFHQISLMT